MNWSAMSSDNPDDVVVEATALRRASGEQQGKDYGSASISVGLEKIPYCPDTESFLNALRQPTRSSLLDEDDRRIADLQEQPLKGTEERHKLKTQSSLSRSMHNDEDGERLKRVLKQRGGDGINEEGVLHKELNRHRRKEERRAANLQVGKAVEGRRGAYRKADSISDEGNVGYINLLFDSVTEPSLVMPPTAEDTSNEQQSMDNDIPSTPPCNAATERRSSRDPLNASVRSKHPLDMSCSLEGESEKPVSEYDHISNDIDPPKYETLDIGRNTLDPFRGVPSKAISPSTLSIAEVGRCFPSPGGDTQPLLLDDLVGESSLRIISEIVIPFILAGLGCVFAGLVLDTVKVGIYLC